MRLVGLMSGTSADGVDAALLEVVGERPHEVRAELVAHAGTPYSAEVRGRILRAMTTGTAETLCDLHVEVAERFADATLGLIAGAGLAPADVAALGSHGQTVWHRPPTSASRGATLQLGDPATLAARTGCPVVSDFRAADVAAGGHGAPLVPWADRILFADDERVRVLLNVGGMANLTRVPRRGVAEPLVAFDTGPGNALLDVAAGLASGGRLACDRDGAMARAGRVDDALVAEVLADPFFDRPPPRSTGRERFGAARVEALARSRGLSSPDDAGWPDLLASLTRVTARAVGDAVERWVLPSGVDEVVVTGGGAHNPALLDELGRALAPLPVRRGADVVGALADAREAAAFALLAWAHLRGVPGNVPGVTGARGPRVLGNLTPAPARD